MSRFLTALTDAFAVLCLVPTSASAGPAADLCTPDAARGGVPADFVLDACADATSMTVRNDLAVPVLVRRDGDLGVPVRAHERGSSAATVLGMASGSAELLMPGDVVRWPLGLAAGALTVTDVDPTTAAVVDAVTSYLPQPGTGDQQYFQAFAGVVREIAAAVQARTACVRGKNFLQKVACDVTTATTVSRAVIAQLPRNAAVEMSPVVLDPARWAVWTATRHTAVTALDPPRLTLSQAAVPVPVVVPPPVPPASSRVPAPAPAVPTVVPAPAPSAPELPDLGNRRTRLGEWLEDALDQAWPPGRGQDGGQGHGGGQGQGRGNEHGRGGR
jgi:hypothetical protein